ncbi:sigma-70 family RNA polymerase sigma factor [Leptospira barantonii]|uniref:Sigma-70 family RNA polymerase sigma factor n=1 Tax=Leptospira barantonii TaxID=2023184 RepID=A0A5F2BUU7_9LEPT|nr:sigma-70 family RNA polymerase sigma factor [Leptospira barantonii]TGM10180.1 sigma-70 family RNA polymerase sigma factor [Leptospira barantonii]
MASLEQFYRRERRKILAWIRYRVADPEEAEDILQESFVSALGEMNAAGEIENVIAYTYAVLRNKVKDWYRKRKTNRYRISTLGEEFELDSFLPDTAPNPEKEFYRSVLLEELALAIEELPADQKFAFVENSFQGKTFQEISSETGIPEGTLSARKTYAKEFLNRRLKDLKSLFLENF